MEDERPDHVLATYREIAVRFGLGGPNAARTKVKRAGWAAEPPNHPADPLRIKVPREAWEQATEAPPRLARESRDGKNGDRPSQNNESRNLNGFVAAVNALERQLEHERSRAGAAEERVRELTEVIASLREAKAAAEAKAGMLESELERLRAPGAPIRLPDLWARLFSRWRHQQAASKSDA